MRCNKEAKLSQIVSVMKTSIKRVSTRHACHFSQTRLVQLTSPTNNVQHEPTLFSKSFASLLHRTCWLSQTSLWMKLSNHSAPLPRNQAKFVLLFNMRFSRSASSTHTGETCRYIERVTQNWSKSHLSRNFTHLQLHVRAPVRLRSCASRIDGEVCGSIERLIVTTTVCPRSFDCRRTEWNHSVSTPFQDVDRGSRGQEIHEQGAGEQRTGRKDRGRRRETRDGGQRSLHREDFLQRLRQTQSTQRSDN